MWLLSMLCSSLFVLVVHDIVVGGGGVVCRVKKFLNICILAHVGVRSSLGVRMGGERMNQIGSDVSYDRKSAFQLAGRCLGPNSMIMSAAMDRVSTRLGDGKRCEITHGISGGAVALVRERQR